MTNYNDGQIHGWNGGECPVHPETVVKVWCEVSLSQRGKAGEFLWSKSDLMTCDTDIIAFRVVKEYVEPRVIWVNEYPTGNSVYASEKDARHFAGTAATRIAVKYQEVR